MKASVNRVAAEGSTKVTTQDVLNREPEKLTIPVRELEQNIEVMVLGFRQNMLEIDDGLGGVDVGAGLGTDFILLKWDGRHAVVRGSELLKAWITTFAPEVAEKFQEDVK